MRTFAKKEHGLAHYKTLLKDAEDGQTYRLFQEDMNAKGAKRFVVATPREMYDFIFKRKAHVYEWWTADMPLSFALDIDRVWEPDTEGVDRRAEEGALIEELIALVKAGAKERYGVEFKDDDIIVLENNAELQRVDNPNKFSAHVIFKGLTFVNFYACREFYNYLNVDERLTKMDIDDSIYRPGCFRVLGCSKMGRRAEMVMRSPCGADAGKPGSDAFYEFWLRSLITTIDRNDPVVDVQGKATEKAKVVAMEKDLEKNTYAINVQHILDNLPANYHNDYKLWIKIGMILSSIDAGDKMERIWDAWSRKSPKYRPGETAERWRSFQEDAGSGKRYTQGSLVYIARQHNIANIYVKPSIHDIVTEYEPRPIPLALDPHKSTIVNQAKLEPELFERIFHHRLLAVQSEKGTGKTTNLFKAMFERNLVDARTSILFISSRVTFGYKLLADLQHYGFRLYSDVETRQIRAKRIICQVDSLLRLDPGKYDMVIIDECESLARYLTSSHFMKNEFAPMIESDMELRIAEASKVVIMDADLSDRSLNFCKRVMGESDDYHVVVNTFTPFQEYSIHYGNYNAWIGQLFCKLEENKRLVVALASNNKAKDICTIIKDRYPDKKVLLIHKETEDEEKKELLLKVNEEWVKHDVVLYTPSVCMGVSFDVPNHFDHIFAYGCHESLGAQEWCQMMHRVRTPASKDIYLTIDDFKRYNEREHAVPFEAMEDMLCSDFYLTHHGIPVKLVKIKMIRNERGEKVVSYPYKDEPVYDLFVRNAQESMSNLLNFPAAFFGYAKVKRYRMTPMEVDERVASTGGEVTSELNRVREERKNAEEEVRARGIMEARDLSKDEYMDLLRNQDRATVMAETDRRAIERYAIKNCYGFAEDDELRAEFVKRCGDRHTMAKYRHLSTVLATPEQSTERKLEILRANRVNNPRIINAYTELGTRNSYAQHYNVLDIIRMLGFDINRREHDLLVPKEDIYERVDEVLTKYEGQAHEFKAKYRVTLPAPGGTTKPHVKLQRINGLIETMYGLRIMAADSNQYILSENNMWADLSRTAGVGIIPATLADNGSGEVGLVTDADAEEPGTNATDYILTGDGTTVAGAYDPAEEDEDA